MSGIQDPAPSMIVTSVDVSEIESTPQRPPTRLGTMAATNSACSTSMTDAGPLPFKSKREWTLATCSNWKRRMSVLFWKYRFLAAAPVMRSARTDVGAPSSTPAICCSMMSYADTRKEETGIMQTKSTVTSQEIKDAKLSIVRTDHRRGDLFQL